MQPFDIIHLWSHLALDFCFLGDFFITVLISVLLIDLFVISIFSWFSLGRLNFSKNLSISSRLSGLLAYQFSSVAQSCPTFCDPMGYSMPGFPVYHQLLEPTQTHVHCVGDTIQTSHRVPLSRPSPPIFSLSQHQGLFQWVGSLHQVAKVLEFQL